MNSNITTLIIGKRSNLSNRLFDCLGNSILISSKDIADNIDILFEYTNNKLNIIFNNFQASTLLNNNIGYDEYIVKAILNTSKILTYIQNKKIKINKIIYTSSSSVYGNNGYCTESDSVNPISLQASLKIANEELIKRFCYINKIRYTIVRLFNMYGGNDKFSIVSKIQNAYFHHEKLNVINNGNAVRDYIHIDDVVRIYIKLLNKSDNIPSVLNVAKGEGQRLLDILNDLSNKGIKVQTNNIIKNEILTSIANVSKLNTLINTNDFVDVKNFLNNEIKKYETYN